jgi:cysteine synthase A
VKSNNLLKPTPLIELKFNDKTIWGKAEYLNPSGSVKDRPIKNILDRAQEAGLLKKGDTIIEATSGNAGISFAMMAAERGMRCVIVMPSNMSQERKKMLRAYGAELIEVEPGDFDGAIALRDKLSREKGWFNGNQFHSTWNIEAHQLGTGPEIIHQASTNCFTPSCFVSGTGTGGTIMGAGVLLKEYYTGMKLVAVEPKESAVMSGGEPGLHGIQGIGDGSKFLVDLQVLDGIITISTDEAKQFTLELSRKFGIFVGFSAAANVLATLRFLEENDLDNGVTILCDRGDRYLSMI